LNVRDCIGLKYIDGITLSKYSDGFIVIRIKSTASASAVAASSTSKLDKKEFYKKGDLIIRDDENHIEFVIKLTQIMNKNGNEEASKNFLRIILDESLAANKNEYSLEHILSNGQRRPIRYAKSEMNIAQNDNKKNSTICKDKKGQLVVVSFILKLKSLPEIRTANGTENLKDKF
jgi:hypothetical protein